MFFIWSVTRTSALHSINSSMCFNCFAVLSYSAVKNNQTNILCRKFLSSLSVEPLYIWHIIIMNCDFLAFRYLTAMKMQIEYLKKYFFEHYGWISSEIFTSIYEHNKFCYLTLTDMLNSLILISAFKDLYIEIYRYIWFYYLIAVCVNIWYEAFLMSNMPEILCICLCLMKRFI